MLSSPSPKKGTPALINNSGIVPRPPKKSIGGENWGEPSLGGARKMRTGRKRERLVPEKTDEAKGSVGGQFRTPMKKEKIGVDNSGGPRILSWYKANCKKPKTIRERGWLCWNQPSWGLFKQLGDWTETSSTTHREQALRNGGERPLKISVQMGHKRAQQTQNPSHDPPAGLTWNSWYESWKALWL